VPGRIDENKLGPRHLVAVLAGSVACATVWLTADRPTTFPQWIVLVMVAAAAGFATTAIAGWLLGWLRSRGWVRRRRHRVALLPVLSAAVALGLASAVAAVLVRPAPAVASCEYAVQLRILSAPSRLAVASELAGAYQQWTATANGGCPTVDPYVYAADPDVAVESLGGGWASALRDVGPRPDVWLPETTAQVEAVRQAMLGADVNLDQLTDQVIGSSPMVLAVAGSQVPDEVAGDRQDLTWQELLGAADTAGWALVRPDPAASVAGELAITALHRGPDAAARAREIEQRIALALDEGGYPLGDTDALLCRHRQREPDGAAGTALLVPEQAMVRYNRGDPLGGPCAGGAAPAEPLSAFYPTDTLTIEQPVAIPRWQEPARPQARAAEAFLRWLQSDPDGVGAVVGSGLRVDGLALTGEHAPLTREFGAIPEAIPPGQTRRPAAPDDTEAAHAVYDAVQRPGRVLLALDLSGSMAEPVDGDRTRYQVAHRGVEASLRQLGDQDEFGIWVFRDTGFGPPEGASGALFRSGSQAAEAVAALDGLQPDGGTPLYRTILAGVDAIGRDADLVTGLVVLTDGEDTDDDPDAEADLAALDRDAGVRVFVVAIGEASCRVEAIARATSRTGGECIQADFDTLEDQLAGLFGVLWSG
jgi:Ca-activated chloride channel homolog